MSSGDVKTHDAGEVAGGSGYGLQIGSALAAYLISTFILFGSPFQPILLVMIRDRLSAVYWVGPLFVSILIGWRAASFFPLKAAAFIVVFLFSIVALTEIVVDSVKVIETRRLDPDRSELAPFIESIHKAPTKFQFFLHTAILKDCRAYAWSYRRMGYYELEPNAARNVLPLDWLQKCPNLEKVR